MSLIENDPICQVIIEAIRQHQTVSVRYKDVDRVMEPHALGTGKDGAFLMRAYQPDHFEDSQAGWKLIRTDRIQKISLTSNPHMGPREGYKRDDSVMREMVFQL
jgi:predicted DNA-binding transcriptional regulator YafY